MTAWPFGTDGDLTIEAGQTWVVAAGSRHDLASLEIQPGGALRISTAAPGAKAWAATVIGVRGRAVINGTLEARGAVTYGVAATPTVPFAMPGQDGAPDSKDTIAVPVPFDAPGGAGGHGGGSYTQTGQSPPTRWPGGKGGASRFGNGGGGGAGALKFSPAPGDDGTAATLEEGGGGFRARADASPLAPSAQDGETGGGGARGSHGLPLVLVARELALGAAGAIRLQGQNGGNGGDGTEAMTGGGLTPEMESNGAGGGGGGGAGGSGGTLWIRYVLEPDAATRAAIAAQTNVSHGERGRKGHAGKQGRALGDPATDGEDGQHGHDGPPPSIEPRRY